MITFFKRFDSLLLLIVVITNYENLLTLKKTFNFWSSALAQLLLLYAAS